MSLLRGVQAFQTNRSLIRGQIRASENAVTQRGAPVSLLMSVRGVQAFQTNRSLIRGQYSTCVLVEGDLLLPILPDLFPAPPETLRPHTLNLKNLLTLSAQPLRPHTLNLKLLTLSPNPLRPHTLKLKPLTLNPQPLRPQTLSHWTPWDATRSPQSNARTGLAFRV